MPICRLRVPIPSGPEVYRKQSSFFGALLRTIRAICLISPAASFRPLVRSRLFHYPETTITQNGMWRERHRSIESPVARGDKGCYRRIMEAGHCGHDTGNHYLARPQMATPVAAAARAHRSVFILCNINSRAASRESENERGRRKKSGLGGASSAFKPRCVQYLVVAASIRA